MPNDGLLDVVRGQGVAGEQHVDVAFANQLADVLAAAGVDDRRARRPAGSCPLAARLLNSSWAICRMATPLGFSVETLLPMNSKAWRLVASARGETRGRPTWPTTNDVPAWTSLIGTQRAERAAKIDGHAAIHLLLGRPRSTCRRGGPRSADSSCCKSPRETPRPCRRPPIGNPCCAVGTAP